MTVINQWQLIHVVLNALRGTKPSACENSFHACNLNPETRVPFLEWCVKIESFLQKGNTFKVETVDFKCLLLPRFWHGILPADKNKLCNLIETQGGFTADCVQELKKVEHGIRMTDMHNLQNFMNLPEIILSIWTVVLPLWTKLIMR